MSDNTRTITMTSGAPDKMTDNRYEVVVITHGDASRGELLVPGKVLHTCPGHAIALQWIDSSGAADEYYYGVAVRGPDGRYHFGDDAGWQPWSYIMQPRDEE